jgi:WD40 repeat protein
MFVVTGDETGLVKVVDVQGRTFLRYGEQQSRSLFVSGLTSPSVDRVASINHQGTLQLYTVDRGDGPLSIVPVSQHSSTIQKPSGLSNVVTAGKADGRVLLFNAAGAASIVNTFSMTEVVNFSVKGPVAAVATCNNAGAIFGGKENDARYYDLTTQQELWAAKNVGQDKLHLRVPVWITCTAFRDSFTDSYSPDGAAPAGGNTTFYTGTAHRHVRMYDMQASRQPVCSFEIGPDYRVSAILPAKGSDSERYLYIADTTGNLTLWDMRTVRRLATLKGAAGSIRQMALSADGRRLACVGLDRFLRVYDTSDNTLSSSVYLKNRLNTCLFMDSGSSEGAHTAKKAPTKPKAGQRRGAAVLNEADEDVLRELQADSDEESGSEEEGSEGSQQEEDLSGGGSEEEGSEEQEDSGAELDEDDYSEGEGSDEEGDSQDGSEGQGEDEDEESSEEEVLAPQPTSREKRGITKPVAATASKKARR